MRDGGLEPAHFPGAKCIGSGLNFFPTKLARDRTFPRDADVPPVVVMDESRERVAPLRALCVRCVWIRECAERGLHGGERWGGIWGGLTDRERGKLVHLEKRGFEICERCSCCGGVYTWKNGRDPWVCGHCHRTWR